MLVKNFKYAFDPHAGKMRLDVIYYLIVYILMLSALVISDAVFFTGILGFTHVTLGGFSTLLWVMAILVFVVNIMLTLVTEKNEFTLESAALALLMLFTYSKLWVFVVVKALWMSVSDAVVGKQVVWDKTVRYEEKASDEVDDAVLEEMIRTGLHKK